MSRLGLIFLAASALSALAAVLSAQQATPATQSASQPSSQPSTQPAIPRDIWNDVAGGKLMLRSFEAAPYPHPSRESGYESSAGKFPREPHYADSTVGIFIPPGFVPGETVDFVVHFHGHKNHVANVLTKFNLLQQMADSHANAILLAPQGPLMAPDSGGGKLELDDDGFKRFITQITTYLREQKLIASDTVGHIALTAHSGGYKTAAGILHRGGMSDHITDVILLDASYGSLPWFADFAEQHPSARLVSFHTQHLNDENVELQRLLDERKVAWRRVDESKLDDAGRGVSFISTKKSHNDVAEYFGAMIRAADLGRANAAKDLNVR